jgi:endo-1,4-beta-D-glucanase Y
MRAFTTVWMLMLLGPATVTAQKATAVRTPEARLAALWSGYRERHIRPAGEVVDPWRQGRVTSEAQSYALLRAVWMRDRSTFERVHAWTDQHLRRPDGLYSWLWDPAEARVIDANSATDADIDIAYALAMASIAFDRPAYATQARDIVRSIRTHAAVATDAGWFPAAGNWAGAERVINLSYFYPYAAPWFERLDPGQGWAQMSAIGYGLLEQALAAAPTSLPADFNLLQQDGTLRSLPEKHALSASFSYDAIRISWRLDVACRMTRDAAACRASEALTRRLLVLLRRDGRFVTQYNAVGVAGTGEESLSFYAAFLPAFTRVAPDVAREWRSTRFADDAIDALIAADNRYYDANWTWFGLAAADGLLEARTPPLQRLRVPR